jgi:hypothetical protein
VNALICSRNTLEHFIALSATPKNWLLLLSRCLVELCWSRVHFIFNISVDVLLSDLVSFFIIYRVRLTIGVEDQTGYTLFHAFDHVMIDIATVNTPIKVCTCFGKQRLDAFSFFFSGWIVAGHSRFIFLFVSGN